MIAKLVHTFTYTPDAGRSMAILGNTPEAYGQIWHALTSKEAMTGEQYVRLACELAGQVLTSIQAWRRMGLRAHGPVRPRAARNMEMMYQFEHDYRFDSSKLEKAFDMEATGYREGIAATLAN